MNSPKMLRLTAATALAVVALGATASAAHAGIGIPQSPTAGVGVPQGPNAADLPPAPGIIAVL